MHVAVANVTKAETGSRLEDVEQLRDDNHDVDCREGARTMRMLSILSLSVAATVALVACADAESERSGVSQYEEVLPQQASAPAQELTPKASIEVLSVSGTGCKPGTVLAFYDEESRTANVQFSSYSMDLPTTSAFMTRNCIINLDVSHEKGLAYAVTRMTYRGFASLPAGTKGVLYTDYTFAGLAQANPLEQAHPIPNVERKSWVFTDEVKSSVFQFSDCAKRRTLTVRTRLSVDNTFPPVAAHLSMESVESSLVPIEIQLAWKPCTLS